MGKVGLEVLSDLGKVKLLVKVKDKSLIFVILILN